MSTVCDRDWNHSESWSEMD